MARRSQITMNNTQKNKFILTNLEIIEMEINSIVAYAFCGLGVISNPEYIDQQELLERILLKYDDILSRIGDLTITLQ